MLICVMGNEINNIRWLWLFIKRTSHNGAVYFASLIIMIVGGCVVKLNIHYF